MEKTQILVIWTEILEPLYRALPDINDERQVGYYWLMLRFRTMCLLFLFSLYLTDVKMPIPTYSRKGKFHVKKAPVFKLLPVSLTDTMNWVENFPGFMAFTTGAISRDIVDETWKMGICPGSKTWRWIIFCLTEMIRYVCFDDKKSQVHSPFHFCVSYAKTKSVLWFTLFKTEIFKIYLPGRNIFRHFFIIRQIAIRIKVMGCSRTRYM